MQTKETVDWKVGIGIALAIFATYNTFSKPLASEGGAAIWLAIMVGLPCWVLLKTKGSAVKIAMVAVIAIATLITIAPSKPSGDGGCEIEWDGRNNPEVC